jgi:rhodanese-related sulfurtransferase
MKRREVLIMIVLLIGSFITIFLPDTKPFKHVITAKQLLYEVNKESRYVSTDQVAKMIIEKDPSLLLIDVRSPQEYKKFTLEGAMNIPFDSILNDNNLDYFNQDVYTTVLFSNGSSLADEAWMILRSYDFQGNKVMKGGLNAWYKTIINPQKPAADALTADLEKQYLFRKGAQVYFTGISPVGTAKSTKPKAPKTPIKKRKKKEVSGGCG